MTAPFEIPVLLWSANAGADLSALQFTAVIMSGANVVGASGDGTAVIGVLQNNPKQNANAQIMSYGITKMVAGEALATVGTPVAASTTGQAIAVDASEIAMGRTVTAAAASGDLVSVLLIPN